MEKEDIRRVEGLLKENRLRTAAAGVDFHLIEDVARIATIVDVLKGTGAVEDVVDVGTPTIEEFLPGHRDIYCALHLLGCEELRDMSGWRKIPPALVCAGGRYQIRVKGRYAELPEGFSVADIGTIKAVMGRHGIQFPEAQWLDQPSGEEDCPRQ